MALAEVTLPEPTELLGYTNLWQRVQPFYANPTHFCIAGIPGCGKTTFVKEFLANYYRRKNITEKIITTPNKKVTLAIIVFEDKNPPTSPIFSQSEMAARGS